MAETINNLYLTQEEREIQCCGTLIITNIEFKGRQDSIDKFMKAIIEKREIKLEGLGIIIKFQCSKCNRKFIMDFIGI